MRPAGVDKRKQEIMPTSAFWLPLSPPCLPLCWSLSPRSTMVMSLSQSNTLEGEADDTCEQ